MTFSLSTRSTTNMARLHPDLRRIVEGAILTTRIDFGITGIAVRTAEQQHALFLKGVTQADGYKHKSNHQAWADGYGHAVDLTPFIGREPILDDRAFLLYPAVASAMSRASDALGLRTRLTWGGNWYEAMSRYGTTEADMTQAVARYRVQHPGPDFIDEPHFQLS